jgi:hypothetical protein
MRQSSANGSLREIPWEQGNLQAIPRTRRADDNLFFVFSMVWWLLPWTGSREFFPFKQGKFFSFAGNWRKSFDSFGALDPKPSQPFRMMGKRTESGMPEAMSFV